MIDWLSFSLRYSGPPVGVAYLKREGWEGAYDMAHQRPLTVEGSHSSKLAVQVVGGRMYVSGNPVKFLTGQNVAGTNDIRRLVTMTYFAVIDRLMIPDCVHARHDLVTWDVNLTRVDCTFSYSVGSDEEVVAWLAAMERDEE